MFRAPVLLFSSVLLASSFVPAQQSRTPIADDPEPVYERVPSGQAQAAQDQQQTSQDQQYSPRQAMPQEEEAPPPPPSSSTAVPPPLEAPAAPATAQDSAAPATQPAQQPWARPAQAQDQQPSAQDQQQASPAQDQQYPGTQEQQQAQQPSQYQQQPAEDQQAVQSQEQQQPAQDQPSAQSQAQPTEPPAEEPPATEPQPALRSGVRDHASPNQIPSGYEFLVTLDEPLDTATVARGKHFRALLREPLVAPNGRQISGGHWVTGHVSAVERGYRSMLLLSFDEIQTPRGWIPLSATVIAIPGEHGLKRPGEEGEIERKPIDIRRTLEGAGVGAVVGASAGEATGDTRTAALGAATGAATGAGISNFTDRNILLDRGAQLILRLDRGVYLP